MTTLPAQYARTIATTFAAWMLAAVAVAPFAAAQSITYTVRNGGNLAYCGPLGSGPLVNHPFVVPGATNDAIGISDPGGPGPASAATANLVVSADASQLAIAVSGSAMRGGPAGFGIGATADGRDNWTFTVGAAVRFTLHVTLVAASTETTVPLQAFNFFGLGGGATVLPDPGSVWPPAATAITAPGSLVVNVSGTLTPGQYFVSLFGRAEGNTAPYTGSYDNALTLDFVPAATAITRNAFGNPTSYSGGAPVLGQTWNASVNVATTGHAFAIVFASTTSAQVTIGPGLTVLMGGPVLDFLPVMPGPVANYTFNMPANASLAGFQLFTQALHFGGAPSFVLSNALDLTLGF